MKESGVRYKEEWILKADFYSFFSLQEIRCSGVDY